MFCPPGLSAWSDPVLSLVRLLGRRCGVLVTRIDPSEQEQSEQEQGVTRIIVSSEQESNDFSFATSLTFLSV